MSDKFLILLGAGSSCGYGFPLWSQVSELLHIQFVEVEKKTEAFANGIDVDAELWEINFSLVKQCVQDVDSGKYKTIDKAVTEYCKKVDKPIIFGRVFWRVMAQAFSNFINSPGNTSAPLNMVVPHRSGGDSLINPNNLERLHIDYLFNKYTEFAFQLKTAIFVDYNYDGLFEYCYLRQYFHGKKEGMKLKVFSDMRSHEIKQSLKQLELAIDGVNAEIQELKAKADNANLNPQPPLKQINLYSRNLEKMKKIIGIENDYDSLVVPLNDMQQLNTKLKQKENHLKKLHKEHEALKHETPTSDLNYFQPHGSFFLSFTLQALSQKRIWRNDMHIASWIQTEEQEQKLFERLPQYLPISCYENTESRFIAINQEIGASKPTILLIMGLSLAALRQNTINIDFGSDIEKVYFTCYEQEQESGFNAFLSEKFPNAKLLQSKTCTDLWDALAQTAKIEE